MRLQGRFPDHPEGIAEVAMGPDQVVSPAFRIFLNMVFRAGELLRELF